jgi:hypothetical protein
VALWAIGLSQTHVPAVQLYGLMSSLPLIYYAGIALLLVSAVIELRRADLSEWRLAAHAVTLAVMLFATAPVVYDAGRYAWLYKTIGVVQYLSAHGQTNDQIDIYQNWPGFFAVAAWFTKLAGVGSPLAYAKWAQVIFELAALPLLYLIYDSFALPIRQRWVAMLLYLPANWIGQDYFSPQAFGTVLSLGIMALAIRWLYTPGPPRGWPIRGWRPSWRGHGSHGHRSRGHLDRHDDASGEVPSQADPRPSKHRLRWWSFPREHDRAWSIAVCCLITAIFFVLSITHQLSPYMIAVQLGALALFKLLRPRWLPLVLAAVAIGYLLPRFAFVNSRFGLLDSLGSFFNNVKPPSQSTTIPAHSAVVIAHCDELLSLGIWCLALLGAFLRARAKQPVLALLLTAFSPIVLLALVAYGNEGVLRVYLFSLPYSAALAASALAPAPAVILARTKTYRARVRQRLRGQGSLRIFVALAIVVGLFFPSFFGDDLYNVMPASEVSTLATFQQNAQPGTIFLAADNGPLFDTSNYNLYTGHTIFGSSGGVTPSELNSHVATSVLNIALSQTSRTRPVYVIIAPSMINYNRAFSQVPPDAFTMLEKSLAATPPWEKVLSKDGTVIYELPAYTQPVYQSQSPSLQPGVQRADRSKRRKKRK